VEGLGDSEMALIAQALSDEIEQEAELIKASQAKQETVKGHIATHRLNQERLLKIEDNLKKIRSLIDKPEKSLTQKDVDEVFKKMEQISKLQLKKMAEKVFQKIKQIGVWRIILVMVSFLAALTTFFYTVWYIRLKKDEKIQYEKLKIKTAKEKEAEDAANEE
ncbi:MAG: hypothetical protein PHV17_09850, partial [Candidatus Omnitrophica bacterium]|nr:hypothetical protein [Candidatus Omnitrophota bacterium]